MSGLNETAGNPAADVLRGARSMRRALAAVWLAVLAIGGAACGPPAPPPQASDIEPLSAYAASAAALRADAGAPFQSPALPEGSSEARIAQIEPLLRELLELGEPVLQEFAAQHPDCVDHFTLVLDARALVDALGPAELARVWVHDGSMPPPPARCQHAQDLVVRPALALAVLNTRGAAGLERALDILRPLTADLAAVEQVYR